MKYSCTGCGALDRAIRCPHILRWTTSPCTSYGIATHPAQHVLARHSNTSPAPSRPPANDDAGLPTGKQPPPSARVFLLHRCDNGLDVQVAAILVGVHTVRCQPFRVRIDGGVPIH